MGRRWRADRRGKGDFRDTWEDSNESVRDGDIDLELRFVRGETQIPPGTSEACAKGSFTGTGGVAYRFFGCGTIIINKPPNQSGRRGRRTGDGDPAHRPDNPGGQPA